MKSLLGHQGAEAPEATGRQPLASRARASARGFVALAALTACSHQAAPQGPPQPLTAQDSVRTEAWGRVPDPVGFLLEYHDSLAIASDQLDALRSINLDLFRRNARVQIAIDSLVPPPSPDAGYGAQPPQLTPDQRARLRQLVSARADNIRRARTDADSVLTPDQRVHARALEERMLARSGRGTRVPR